MHFIVKHCYWFINLFNLCRSENINQTISKTCQSSDNSALQNNHLLFSSFRTMIGIQEDVLNMFLISHFLILFSVGGLIFAFTLLLCVRMNPQVRQDARGWFWVGRQEEFSTSRCMWSNQGRGQDYLGDYRTWSNKGSLTLICAFLLLSALTILGLVDWGQDWKFFLC